MLLSFLHLCLSETVPEFFIGLHDCISERRLDSQQKHKQVWVVRKELALPMVVSLQLRKYNTKGHK